jgi:hypothetical protein
MKVSCPNCQKVIQAPDDWAGKKVKCPACKGVIALPEAAKEPAAGGAGLDLGSLASLEDAGEVIYAQRKKRITVAQADALRVAEAGDQPKVTVDPTVRSCPKCGQKVKSEDIYSELECRHCGAGIPGVDARTEATRYTSGMMDRITTQVSFYTGFSSAFAYPIPALVWILMGMGIAMGTIALPLLAVLGFTAGSGLNEISEKADLSWVGIFLTVAFIAQGIYFSAVAYYVMIDTIRTTSSGGEQAPALTWNVISLGTALAGYAALLGFYCLVAIILLSISNGHMPSTLPDLAALARPANIFVLAMLTFAVPMNMIGLSSSHALDGLNPVRTFRSIARVGGHYFFLFLITLIYLGIYIGGVAAVMKWAGPAIMDAANKGMGVGFFKMLGGPIAWCVLIGLGFYFSYMIGRILGLFARTYKEHLEFDL